MPRKHRNSPTRGSYSIRQDRVSTRQRGGGVFRGASPLIRGVLRGVSPLSRGVLRGVSPLRRGLAKGGSPLHSTPIRLSARRLLRKIPPHNLEKWNKIRTRWVERFRQSLPISKQIKICERRHKRREVLFATKRLNGSASKKITADSKVRC